MCNLYSITAIAALFRLTTRFEGNLAAVPSVFPDYTAPVVRSAGDGDDRGTESLLSYTRDLEASLMRAAGFGSSNSHSCDD